MKRPRLLNGQPVLLEAAVFDGYDIGILMHYIEGANKVMFARSGFFIRRGDHPFYRYWREPKPMLTQVLCSSCLRGSEEYLVDSYPERNESAEALLARMKQRSI